MTERVVRLHDYEQHRRRYLPGQLADTRRKLAALETEARRLGMTHLLEK